MKYLITIVFTIFLVATSGAQQEDATIPDFSDSSEQINPLQKVSLHPFSTIDPQNILNPEQREKIKKEQQLFLEDYDCLVSYGFYGIHVKQSEIKKIWLESKPPNEEKFHILINIGSFLENHSIEVIYRNPPLLDDINEVENILARAKQSMQSEQGLDDILKQSFVSVNDELPYLSTRPILEKNQSDAATASKNKAFKDYIIKTLKIGLCIVVPMIVIYVLWNILSTARNKKPYYFPETTSIPRLGAPHGATSIIQTHR